MEKKVKSNIWGMLSRYEFKFNAIVKKGDMFD